MKEVELFGSGTANKSYVVTRQRRLNVYFERRTDGDKHRYAVYGTPGLQAAFTVTTPSSFPLRGFYGTQNHLYMVAYNQFQEISNTGATISTGSMGTLSGNVGIFSSPTQVVVVDGNAGYVYTIATNTFASIASFPAVGANTVTFIGGFFVCEQPGTQSIWASNSFDGSTWNALAFASASGYADTVLAVDNLGGNLVVFSQLHTEFWQNVGTSPFPFAPILSAFNEYGLAAISSRAHVDQKLIFLAQNREGQVQVVELNGYVARVISDADIESIINGLSVVSDAVALTYQIDTHKFYQITFPTENRSFLYDTSVNLWSDVQTGASLSPSRHWGNLSAYCGGKTYISDYATNQVYTMSPTTYTDNGQLIARELVTRHVLSEFNRIRISLLYLDMETGVGLQVGQGVNPMIMLQYSKDNGRTWSAERWVSAGPVGQYLYRVLWRRFGSTRDATFRIRMTDPVKFVITKGAMKIRERIQ